MIGTLVEIRDTFIVLDGHTHIMLPPGLKVGGLRCRRAPHDHRDAAERTVDR
jgi:hypothetical protein